MATNCSLEVCSPEMGASTRASICVSAPSGTTAVDAHGTQLSYSQLHERIRAVAASLNAVGVHRGSVVAICLPRSANQIVAMAAAWRLGAAYLPLDPSWPDARLADLIATAGCDALVAEAGRGLRIAGATPLVAPNAAQGGPLPETVCGADDLAYVIYTSGSTGTPKAVEVTHGNLAALVAWHLDAFGVQAGTRTSHLAGLGFDAAAWEIWPTLVAGGTLVLADDSVRTDPEALRDWLVRERIEVAFAPTVLAEPLVTMDWPRETALKVLLTGADKLKVRPAPDLPFRFVNNYGPTESTVVATSGDVAPHGEGLPSIGRPIAGTAIHLLDADGRDVGAGEEGEIHIAGAQVARGYRGDPALTAARFIQHPRHGRLYRTGDLGAWLPDGELAFRGRVDAQVKVRGHRVEPAEIAAALGRRPEVAASHVVARDEGLVAYVVPAAAAPVEEGKLQAALAETLPDYMVPSRFVTIDALPLTANGKIDAKALPDPGAAPAKPQGRGPETPTERRLLEIVRGVVGRCDIGVDDDFFLVGGHSLLATQVVIRARDAFGVELTLFHLFEGRTVGRLAIIIEELAIAMLDQMSDEDVARMVG
jgi:amino acid adenylation domain-containing protein